jgi:hypothetical protein
MLWIEFTAWMRDPDKITANFLDAVAAIDEAGMKVMPCLFNRWHDGQYDYGGTHAGFYSPHHVEYVRALVTPLIADERILIWDLCNEPQAFGLEISAAKEEIAWLTKMAATVRACGARQPITIGTHGPLGHEHTQFYYSLVDVLCSHPYVHTSADLRQQIDEHDELRKRLGKPLLVNETMPGCLDDLKRAELVHFYTELLSAADMGWMGWALREGLAISTRRDRHDANGLNGEGFHPFFTKEGRLRDGLEFLTKKPKLSPPWESTPR